jgi:deoxyadenosine/deoxycytidine kinase
MNDGYGCKVLDDCNIHQWISLQGNIGAGKSTLLKLVKQELIERRLLATQPDAWDDGRPLFVVLEEPVNEWDVKKYFHPKRERLLAFGVVLTIALLAFLVLSLVLAVATGSHPTGLSILSGLLVAWLLFASFVAGCWCYRGVCSFPGGNAILSILELFYNDPSQYAFVFQVEAFTSRLNNLVNVLLQLVTRKSNPPICIVSERSLSTDALFFRNLWQSGQVQQVEYDTYQRFFACIAGPLLKRETVMVHIPTLPKECHRRIAQRARDGENNVSLEYLETIEDAHQQMLHKFTGRLFTLHEFHQDMPSELMQQSAKKLVDEVIVCCRQ